jgi:hypothetical protein
MRGKFFWTGVQLWKYRFLEWRGNIQSSRNLFDKAEALEELAENFCG